MASIVLNMVGVEYIFQAPLKMQVLNIVKLNTNLAWQHQAKLLVTGGAFSPEFPVQFIEQEGAPPSVVSVDGGNWSRCL